jgi:hypothetical protein
MLAQFGIGLLAGAGVLVAASLVILGLKAFIKNTGLEAKPSEK